VAACDVNLTARQLRAHFGGLASVAERRDIISVIHHFLRRCFCHRLAFPRTSHRNAECSFAMHKPPQQGLRGIFSPSRAAKSAGTRLSGRLFHGYGQIGYSVLRSGPNHQAIIHKT
jgi:hypothetical protein